MSAALRSLRKVESRFLILNTTWRINVDAELKCDGLLCKTCREGLQIFAVFEGERLQVDQLTEAFGQCHQLRPREVQFGGIPEVWVLHDALWPVLRLLDARHEAFTLQVD